MKKGVKTGEKKFVSTTEIISYEQLYNPRLFTNSNCMVIIVKTHLGFEFFEFLY